MRKYDDPLDNQGAPQPVTSRIEKFGSLPYALLNRARSTKLRSTIHQTDYGISAGERTLERRESIKTAEIERVLGFKADVRGVIVQNGEVFWIVDGRKDIKPTLMPLTGNPKGKHQRSYKVSVAGRLYGEIDLGPEGIAIVQPKILGSTGYPGKSGVLALRPGDGQEHGMVSSAYIDFSDSELRDTFDIPKSETTDGFVVRIVGGNSDILQVANILNSENHTEVLTPLHGLERFAGTAAVRQPS